MELFITSDTHFSHGNICKFLTESGEKQRPWNDYLEMDEVLVDNWNRVVGRGDKVIHLGDVTMKRKYLPILSRLNGRKTLIMGNHDIFPAQDYLKYFEDIKSYMVIDMHILSHIPVHPDSKGRFLGNIHGHTHTNRILTDGKIDWYYQNICVEVNDYTPVSYDEIPKRINFEYALYK